jgi:2TM domain-containing protein
MNDEAQVIPTTEEDLREEAIKSIKRKQGFKQTAFAYVVVNLLLIGIWAISGTDNYFWPVWVIGGWGIGLAFQAYDAYGRRRTIGEDQIASEMQKLRR